MRPDQVPSTTAQNRALLASLCTAMLVLLWSYTALSKLADFQDFQRQLHNQQLGYRSAWILVRTLPATELLLAVLLLFGFTRHLALLVSLVLLIAFSSYIGLILIGFFDRIPCSCGGVLQQLGWWQHLLFNLFFIGLNLIALSYSSKERRYPKAA